MTNEKIFQEKSKYWFRIGKGRQEWIDWFNRQFSNDATLMLAA